MEFERMWTLRQAQLQEDGDALAVPTTTETRMRAAPTLVVPTETPEEVGAPNPGAMAIVGLAAFGLTLVLLVCRLAGAPISGLWILGPDVGLVLPGARLHPRHCVARGLRRRPRLGAEEGPVSAFDPELVGTFRIVSARHVEIDTDNIAHLDGAACLSDLRAAGWQSLYEGLPDDDVDQEIASAWYESAEVDYDGDGETPEWDASPYEVLDHLRQQGITFVRPS